MLHATEFHSLHATVYAFTYVRIYRIVKVDNLKIIHKKVNVLWTASSRRRHVQLCVSEDTGDMHIVSHTVVPGTGSISRVG